MPEANVDLIGYGGQGEGQLAQMMLQHGRIDPGRMRKWFDPKTKRAYITVYKGSGDPSKPENYQDVPIQANATLRRDEWKQLDEAVLRISEERIGGWQDAPVFNLGNAMGTTVLEYHDISDAMEAELTMDGITRSTGDRPAYTTNYLPLPIIHADYEINARVLSASRNLGQPLDTDGAERATRKVLEKLENLFFTDTTYTYGGGTIYSYVNHTDRNQYTLTAGNGNWDSSSATGAEIIQDVLGMKQASINAFHYGPWNLYVCTDYETVLDDDYDSTTPGTTIRERIMKIGGINDVKVIDKLPDNEVLLVQMTTDVVRLVNGMGIQNVEWEEQGGMVTKYKVMTIRLPQIRSDQDGNSGIVHGS